MKYHCIRGTNSVEGAVHMNIVRKFSSYNTGPRLANSVLADYRLYHNIDVGSKNRYSKIHKGHYSPWLSLAINTLRTKLGHEPIKDYYCNRLGSIFEFEQTKETFGITALPVQISRQYNLESLYTQSPTTTPYFSTKKLITLSALPVISFENGSYSSVEYLYKYLSECQNTKIAVTSVRTKKEIQLLIYKFLFLISLHYYNTKFAI